jgi:hypothetical protein
MTQNDIIAKQIFLDLSAEKLEPIVGGKAGADCRRPRGAEEEPMREASERTDA